MSEDLFGSEDRMHATNSVISILDALDSEEIQAAVLELRQAAIKYRAVLIEAGITPQAAALSVMGAALGHLITEAEAEAEA